MSLRQPNSAEWLPTHPGLTHLALLRQRARYDLVAWRVYDLVIAEADRLEEWDAMHRAAAQRDADERREWQAALRRKNEAEARVLAAQAELALGVFP
jgi:hypothetical protein